MVYNIENKKLIKNIKINPSAIASHKFEVVAKKYDKQKKRYHDRLPY